MTIKVLGIVATPVKGDTNTEILCQAVLDAAMAQGDDVQIEVIRLSEMNLKAGCTHCNWCLERQTPERHCAIDDDMKIIYPKLIETDTLVLASPVYIGRMSWLLAEFIDRLRALGEGRYYGIRGPYGGAMADKVMTSCAVAWVRHGGVETALLSMQWLANILGGVYISGGFGHGVGGVSAAPLGHYGAVKDDKLAMASARAVGKEIVRMTRIIKAGKDALRLVPAYVR